MSAIVPAAIHGASGRGSGTSAPDGPPVRIGTAGWSVPARYADIIPAEGAHLHRYGAVFDAVEINTSFHRPHRRSTYERWASMVGPDFRFAVKLPRTISHDRRLSGCDDLIARFADETAGLGAKRGPVLVQLPPSLAFSEAEAGGFFGTLAAMMPGAIVCEPRHPSWFEPMADAFLRHRAVARVAADPARVALAAEPGGWRGIAYFRMHGTPRVYYSDYGDRVEDHAGRVRTLRAADIETWFIYDNTASGAAMGDAIRLARASGRCSSRSSGDPADAAVASS